MATSTSAATIDIDLSLNDGELLVEGTIFGIEHSGTSAASSIEVIVEPKQGALRTFQFDISNASTNAFSVSGGNIASAAFTAQKIGPVVFDLQFDENDPLNDAWLFFSPVFNVSGTELAFESGPLSAVPLPAGGLMLLSALAGFTALRRRKTSIA